MKIFFNDIKFTLAVEKLVDVGKTVLEEKGGKLSDAR